MIDELKDIEILENAISAFTEGASDDKRNAIDSLRLMIDQKQALINQFEREYENELSN